MLSEAELDYVLRPEAVRIRNRNYSYVLKHRVRQKAHDAATLLNHMQRSEIIQIGTSKLKLGKRGTIKLTVK